MDTKENTLLFTEAKHFVTIKDERLLIARRQHVLTLVPTVLLTSIGLFISIILLSAVAIYSPPMIPLVISLLLLIVAISLILVSRSVAMWQFHLYIITNKKILEATYVPLSDYSINEILLEQVKCTEVDIHTHGIIHELLDIGDISLTFDRPTHDENFKLHLIPDVRETAVFLTSELIEKNGSYSVTKKNTQQAWFRDKIDSSDPSDKAQRKYRYSEEKIFERK